MAIENHFINYTTLYLSRREEILIHSIIALYSSKDGFKWINNATDAAVVMIGSDIKKINDSDDDPFALIKKEQIVCILGDMFYPKNARAVIRIDLPIRALQLVERLSEIERDYMQAEFALNYVAANHLAKNNAFKKMQEEQSSINSLLNRDGMIDFVISEPTELTQENKQKDEQGDNSVITHLELFKTLDLQLETNKAEAKSEAKPFSLELVDSVEQEQVYTQNVVDIKSNKSASVEATLGKRLSTFSPVSNSVSLKEEIRLAPPTLTEVVSGMPEVVSNKIADNLQLKVDLPEVKHTTVSSEDKNTSLAAMEGASTKNTADSSSVEQNKQEDKVGTSAHQHEDISPRIKLLRWPKASLIQQHPGNAILASMVINVPMSVSDMAKQSDLPISVCQRFFDAVVAAKVAEYVDQVIFEDNKSTDKSTNNTTKRKGILYRIRVALGLVRK